VRSMMRCALGKESATCVTESGEHKNESATCVYNNTRVLKKTFSTTCQVMYGITVENRNLAGACAR
jgi:hypothetical protein